MISALKQAFEEAAKLPDDEQNCLAASVKEQLQDFKGPSNKAAQDEISSQIKCSIKEFESGQGVDAITAMRELADKFGIKSSR